MPNDDSAEFIRAASVERIFRGVLIGLMASGPVDIKRLARFLGDAAADCVDDPDASAMLERLSAGIRRAADRMG